MKFFFSKIKVIVVTLIQILIKNLFHAFNGIALFRIALTIRLGKKAFCIFQGNFEKI